jgi:hypothetical protein
MHIRPAQSSDLARIAAIGVEAFANEPIYAHFFPRRSLYPGDYHSSFIVSYKRMLNTPGQIIMVAERDEQDDPVEEQSLGDSAKTKVVGFATFIRSGPQEEVMRWNGDDMFKRVKKTPHSSAF